MQALLGDGDPGSRAGQALCVQDKLNHASLIDAARLAGCRAQALSACRCRQCASANSQSRPDAAALLATDGVFSMDGDIAPLDELAALCKTQQATLMVDDAHGLGVLGRDGAGSVAEAGLEQGEVPVLMATLGKALGVGGAFVAGSATLIDGLVQFARTHIYTTAMPPALAAAASMPRSTSRVSKAGGAKNCCTLIAHFRHGASERGIPLLESRTPIQPVLIGASHAALTAAQTARRRGILRARDSTADRRARQGALRIALSATHEEADVEHLLECACTRGRACTLAQGSI